MKPNKNYLLLVLAVLCVTLSTALADLFPNPNNCSTYTSYDSNKVGTLLACPVGLDFSPVSYRCLPPAQARCQQQYWCPPSNPYTPVYVPDPINCKFYYVCNQGTPIKQQCGYGLWWNVITNRCASTDFVLCDKRTITNPNNPGIYDTTTAPPPTTQGTGPTTTTTTPVTVSMTTTSTIATTTLAPNKAYCTRSKDIFNGNVYVKTACIVIIGMPYINAKKSCATNNMNLFTLDDSNVETELFDIMDPVWPGGTFWINGQRANNSKEWFIYNIDGTLRGQLYNRPDFYSSFSDGSCLTFSGQYSSIPRALGLVCTGGYWFICEHFKKTENPVVLDQTICDYAEDLYDSLSNKYLKSVCIVRTGKTYDDARRGCKNTGMNLFTFDNELTTNMFFEYTSDFFKTYTSNTLWVNGRRNYETDDWLTYHANRTVSGLLYNGIEWVNVNSFYGRTNGYCLRISGERGPYQFVGDSCNRGLWYICEYRK